MLDAKKTNIGIIGFGNMGSAIAEKIKPVFKPIVFDKDRVKIDDAAGMTVARDLTELTKLSDVILLAVKPQDFDEVLSQIKNDAAEKLIISIAAGKSTAGIEKVLGEIRVIRVMPNLPAKIGEGMSCLCRGKFANDEDLKFAETIFRFLGDTLVLDENMIDKVTAVSGSGPGFLYSLITGKSFDEAKKFAENDFMPLFVDCALKLGFTNQQAKILAGKTTSGSMKFLEKSGLSAEELTKMVASKGGTTEAGLKELKGDVKRLPDAVEAAKKRAEELNRR